MKAPSKKPAKLKRYAEEAPGSSSVVGEPAVAYLATPVNLTINYLGGKQALRGAKLPESEYEYIDLIHAGLPKLSFDYLLNITGLPLTELAGIFNITDRTLRRYTASTIMNREQSERAVEIARLYSKGSEILGSLENFKEWMGSPIPALGGKMPKTYLNTSLGINLLTKLLGRIEYGVYS